MMEGSHSEHKLDRKRKRAEWSRSLFLKLTWETGQMYPGVLIKLHLEEDLYTKRPGNAQHKSGLSH